VAEAAGLVIIAGRGIVGIIPPPIPDRGCIVARGTVPRMCGSSAHKLIIEALAAYLAPRAD